MRNFFKTIGRTNRTTLLVISVILLAVLPLILFAASQKKQTYTNAASPAAQATAASFVIGHTNTNVSTIAQANLDKARQLKVLFTHQSVGVNILSGLDDLAGQNSTRYALKRAGQPQATWYDTNSEVGDFTPGSNGDPASKVTGFNNLIRNGYGTHINVAMMKFCYVDFGNAQTAWNVYLPAMEALIRDYPNVQFVWWTAPITTNDANNGQRAIFNNLVRQYVAAHGGILFDIADIESHDPSGNAVTNAGTEAMYSGYSSDGGHLNTAGSDLVASAWWELMAGIATAGTALQPGSNSPVPTY